MGNINEQQSEKAEIAATNQQKKKVRGRPFPKGVSGNPNGKPVGTKSFSTLFDEAIKRIVKEKKLPIDDPEIEMATKAIVEALKGNFPFWRDLMDRRYGQAVKPVDLTTGGESFFRPTDEEREKANKAIEELL